MGEKILRLPRVKQDTGLSRSTIYLEVSRGRFPKPIRLGDRAVGWLEQEVQGWLAERIRLSRAKGEGDVLERLETRSGK